MTITGALSRTDTSRALALLATHHAMPEVAREIGVPVGTIRDLVGQQAGWVIDKSACVYDPNRPGYRVGIPGSVNPEHLAWAKDLKSVAAKPAPPVDGEPAPQPGGSVDQLLADARSCDDKRVQRALKATLAAVETLRGRYASATQRAAEEEAKERERLAVVEEVAKLEAALAVAKSRAKQVGAKLSKTPPTRVIDGAADPGRDPAKWHPGKETTAMPARKYTPGTDYRAAEVRAWAKEQGYGFPRNGRFLPDSLVQTWLNEQGGAA